MNRCHYCGKLFSSFRAIRHINIERDPPIFYFCTQQHKLFWILESQQSQQRNAFLKKFFREQKKRFAEEKEDSLKNY